MMSEGGSTSVVQEFTKNSEIQLKKEEESLQDKKEIAKQIPGSLDKTPGWNSDPVSETDRFVNDAFIANQEGKIGRMKDAIGVLQRGQTIVAENGEVSKRKFGDIVWGYMTQFPDTDGSIVQESLNVMLVPSALVGEGSFKVEINKEETELVVVSPHSDIGKRVIESSL